MGLSHLQFGYRGEVLRILPTVPDDTRAELPWSRGERFLLTLGFMLGLLRSEPQLERIWGGPAHIVISNQLILFGFTL